MDLYMSTVHIGIGSNLGDREEHCLKAIRLFPEKGVLVRRRSSVYETEPWGVKDQARFLNMAIEGETALTPARLLEVLKMIEDEVGRVETYRWGPRVIDLDILLYDDLVMSTPELTIPHPRMHEREFVLRPLAEIAPDKTHPVLKKTVKELLSDLSTQ
jgi:2-amino-4-hydroxy-6-hydroxymethyldihydropteridine diphosphokinase